MGHESDPVVAAISAMSDNLSRRIESVEDDFLQHLKKVEDRLNVLVDLAKTVAVLQTQTSHFFEELSELRAASRESGTRFDQSLQRTHARIDETQATTRDRVELAEREFGIAMKSISADTATRLQGLTESQTKLGHKIENWFSWARGAYAVAAILGVFIVWTGNRWLTDLEGKVNEIHHLKTQIIDLNNRRNNHGLHEPKPVYNNSGSNK